MAEEKNSPLKILPVLGMAVSAAGSIYGAVQADKQQKAAAAKEAESRKEMDRLRNVYANLDTSNPFMNMENTMEDLTIDQKQAEFQSQQFQQSQANILEGLRGSAGGSGVAALAQQLAQSGQLAAQQSSASIGQQESRNQMAAAQQAGQLQLAEASGAERAERLRLQGAEAARGLEYSKAGTLLGMSQQRVAAANQARAQAKAAQMGAVGDIATAGLSLATASLEGLGDSYGSYDSAGNKIRRRQLKGLSFDAGKGAIYKG